jgi:hypothetical protein
MCITVHNLWITHFWQFDTLFSIKTRFQNTSNGLKNHKKHLTKGGKKCQKQTALSLWWEKMEGNCLLPVLASYLFHGYSLGNRLEERTLLFQV